MYLICCQFECLTKIEINNLFQVIIKYKYNLFESTYTLQLPWILHPVHTKFQVSSSSSYSRMANGINRWQHMGFFIDHKNIRSTELLCGYQVEERGLRLFEKNNPCLSSTPLHSHFSSDFGKSYLERLFLPWEVIFSWFINLRGNRNDIIYLNINEF